MELANKTRYLDTKNLQAVEKHITDKALNSLRLMEVQQLHTLANALFMKQPTLEKIEAHLASRLLQEDMFTNFYERPHLIKKYLGVFTLNRKKTSHRQLEDCLRIIDRFYGALVVSGSEQRLTLRHALYKLELLTRANNSPLHDLHSKVLELAFRDPSLQVNERDQKKEELARQVEEMRKEVASMTRTEL